MTVTVTVSIMGGCVFGKHEYGDVTPGEEAYYCSRTRVPEKVQLPVNIPDLIPGGPRGPEEGDNISIGILQLRVDHQWTHDGDNHAQNIPKRQVSWKTAANGIVGHRAH